MVLTTTHKASSPPLLKKNPKLHHASPQKRDPNSRAGVRIGFQQPKKIPPTDPVVCLSVCLSVSYTEYLKKKKKRRRRSDTKDLHLALQNRSLESKTNHIQQKQQKIHLWLGKEEEYSAGSRITQRTPRVSIFVRVIAHGKRVTGK
jgi:hypothetical protein